MNCISNYYSLQTTTNNLSCNHTLTNKTVFIDSQVKDYEFLRKGVIEGIEVIILQNDRDGIEQITKVLSQIADLATIHIVSHGSPGCLYLGNSRLSLDTLNRYAADLEAWFSSNLFVSPSHSLLMYGCNVAAGDAGEEFIAKLHKITGAEIAASTTPIGDTTQGGNWELDRVTSEQSIELAFSKEVQTRYARIFAPGDLPWEANPLNNGILVRGTAFLNCGTLVGSDSDHVLAVERVDIRADGTPVLPTSGEDTVTNALTWSHEDWTQEKLGNVYGLAIDDLGNMFTTASANYGSGVGFRNDAANINYGSIGRDAGGELGAAGTIYKMDAVTGEPTVFAQLPQQETTVTNIDPEETRAPDITRQTGPGLGNIHHDKVNNQFFVSNFEDGRIYRLDRDGNILDSYDPGALDDGSAGIPSISELVYGLTVSPDGSKLFYGLNKEVYSIDLNGDGSLPGTVDNTNNIASATWDNYAGATETKHSEIPPADGNIYTNAETIISDLEFLPNGKLMVGARAYTGKGTGTTPTIFTAYNHGGSVYELTENGGIFSDRIEIQGYSTVTPNTGNDDGYGGVAYSQNLDGSFDYVVSSADITTEDGPHGIAVFPDDASNLTGTTEIRPKAALGYESDTYNPNTFSGNDLKGVGGEVNVFNPAAIKGNVSEDSTDDGNGDNPINGVIISLLDDEGNPLLNATTGEPITTTTDVDGNYVFDNLLAGDYTVVQTQPPGFDSVSENEGGSDDDRPDNGIVNSIDVSVAFGEIDEANDFVEKTIPTDFGDASDRPIGSTPASDSNSSPDYQTTAADSGAYHTLDADSPVTIGTTVDADDGRAQNTTATADDNNDSDDEEGVFVTGTQTALDNSDAEIAPNGNYSVDVIIHDGVTPIPLVPTGVAATVSGNVYNDYDNDGTQEINNGASEVGLEGITVTAYGSDGDVVSTTTTDANGAYTLDNPNGAPLRVEFTDLPEGFTASAVSGGDANAVESVFFTDGASEQTANLGLIEENRYVNGDSSPLLIVPCYVDSRVATGNEAAIVTVLHSDSGNNPASEQTLVTENEIGAVYGIAYNKETEDIYTAAFQKRFSDVGPEGNDAIYRVDSSGNVSTLINLDDFFGADSAGAYAHGNPDGSVNWQNDTISFDAVGKVAFGDVEISEDRQHIWTINLADRKLYKIEVGDGSTHTDGDGRERIAYDILGDDLTAPTNNGIPLGDLGNNAADDIRPFALAEKDGLIYVGMVNSAQTSQNAEDLQAYVYTFDPANPDAGYTKVLDFDLNYSRERKNFSFPVTTDWDPWVSNYSDFTSTGGAPDQVQPILSDIEFDNDGNMILGLRDRTGDQGGLLSDDTDPNNGAQGDQIQTGGETLRANWDGSQWVIEPSVTDTDTNTNTNPEFYGGDDFFINNGPVFFNGNQFNPFTGGHLEASQGALVQIPGYNSVESTVYDPVNTLLSGGIRGFDNTTGDVTRGLNLYVSGFNANDPFFSKANGLGDLEYAGELAPIEIGNRIWNDLNNNGIQDAGEVGFEGVTVNLYDADNNLVGTATTDATGEYYFNNDNVNENGATGLVPFTDYQIRLDNPDDFADGGVLNGYDLTVENANDNNSDTTDSDAANVDAVPTIAVTTGDYGANDYSNDAGFYQEPPEPPEMTLVGWVDFNRDGVFSEDEAVTIDTDDANPLITDGVTPNTLEFSVPDTVPKGPTAARFRVATGLTGDNLDATTSIGGAPNGEVEDYVVNLVPLHKLSGTVFSDTQDEAVNAIDLPDDSDPDAPIPGDTPIAGVTVELFANDGSGNPSGEPLQSVVTDENGFYEFTELNNGDYIVVESQPDDFDSVTDIDNNDDNQILVTVLDEDNTGNNFLEEIPTDYGDAPDNFFIPGSAAAPDNTTPPEYRTTFAEDGPRHAIAPESPVTIGSGVDSDNGTQQNPNATADDNDADGNDADGVFLEGTNTSLASADVEIAPNGNYRLDVIIHDGFTPIPTGVATTVAGTVFNDFDNNGTQELGNPDSEVGLEGVTVTAYNNAGDVVATATTDVDGAYTLDNSNGEALKLEFTDLPADFVPSSSGAVADAVAPVAYVDGAANATANLGLFVPTGTESLEIGNRVWKDTNSDGIQDGGEAGVEGVTVSLYDATGTTLLATTLTDAKGEYYFNDSNVNQNDAAGLTPNTDYQIRLDNTADFEVGGVLDGLNLTVENANSDGNDSSDSDAVDNDGTPTISVTTGNAGENNYAYDAGFTDGFDVDQDITLVGWIDFNRDGEFSESEAVTLDSSNGLVADGVTPNTLEFSVPDTVPKGPTAARFRVATGLTSDNLDATTSTGAAPNGEVEDYIVNLVPLHKLSGTVFSDTQAEELNAIDLPDNSDPNAPIPGDTPIAGVTVELFANDGSGNPSGEPLQSVVTDENGFYEFTELLNGNYILVESQPTAFDSVTDIDDTDDNKILATILDEDNTGNDFLEEIPVDYGDAPDTLAGSAAAPDNATPPDYLTTFAEDGARHAIAQESPVTIGSEVDSDNGTQQNPTATADDNDLDGDDADGVFLEGTSTTLDGQDAVVTEGGNYGLDVIVHDGVTPIPTPASGILTTVSGTVFNDSNLNGENNGESGVENVSVTAYDAADNVVAAAQTGADGTYTLTDLDQGSNYRIEFTALPDGHFSGPNGADSNGPIVFVDGTTNTVDYGVIDPAQIDFNQPAATDILQNGYAVYSCFAINTDDVALAIRDLTGETAGANNIGDIGEIFDNGQVGDVDSGANLSQVTTFTRSQFGGNQIQATAVDSRDGTIYVATSSMNATYDLDGGAFNHEPNVDNPAPGQVYRISPDGNTVELFATTPGNLGTGWLELDEEHDQIYISNPDDGQIYVVDATATAGAQTASTSYPTFAPHSADNINEASTASDLIAPLGELILGVGYNKAESRLYYSIWGQDYNANGATENTIRSVAINPDGSIDASSDRLEVTTPNNSTILDRSFKEYSNTSMPVTDIEFNEAGTIMLLAEQSLDHSFTTQQFPRTDGSTGFAAGVWAHGSRVLEYQGGTNNWSGEAADKHSIGKVLNETDLYRRNSRGGVDFAFHSINNDNVIGNEEYIIAAGDALPFLSNDDGSLLGIYGFQYHPLTGGDNDTALKIDGDGNTSSEPWRVKGQFSDIDIRVAYQSLEIGNRVWLDSDRDGIQDATEIGIEGVTVSLYDADDNLVATTTTDSKGEYYFNNGNVNLNGATGLTPNTNYQIRLDNTADFADGGALNGLDLTVEDVNGNGNDTTDSDAVDNDDGTPTIDVTTGNYGENDHSYDVGFNTEQKDITLVGWVDFNRDGVFSEDEAVAIDTDNGLVTDGATPNTLEFAAPETIEPGLTAARFRVATGLVGDNLDATTSTGAAPNGEVEDYIVNLVPAGSLSGNVSEDTNLDGEGDTPIAGVILTLFDSDSREVATTTTDEEGNYIFEDLAPGNYTVVETQPDDYFDVSEDEGGEDDDRPNDNTPNSIDATVDSKEEDTKNDFVEVKEGSLSGNVSEDTTGNTEGDLPLEGVILTLFDSDGDQVTTTTTDEFGNYIFENLLPGEYTVKETQPDDLLSVSEDEGGADDDKPSDEEINSIQAIVSPNEEDVNNDFIEGAPGSISGSVLEDTTGNGEGDNPLENITLTLYAADGSEPVLDDSGNLITATTGTDGTYSFPSVPPGNYTIVQTQPAGYLNVSEDEGGADDDFPDNNVANSIAVNVVPGVDDEGNNFVEALIPPSDLGDAPDTLPGSQAAPDDETPPDYQTTAGDGGAIHELDEDCPITIGTEVDGDDGTQQDPDAIADGEDEAGVKVAGTDTALDGTDAILSPGDNYGVDVIVHDGITPIVEAPPADATTISGTVFNDSNVNGANDIENGVENITVTAYDAAGNAAATATTAADGTYTLEGLGAENTYRVEFGNLPEGYAESVTGEDSSGAVTFATIGDDNVSLGLKQASLNQPIDNALATSFGLLVTCGADEITDHVMALTNATSLPYATATYNESNGLQEFHHEDWTLEKIGNIFFTEFDDKGNIFAPASRFTQTQYVGGGNNNIALQQYGSIGGSDAIYKMDAVTGEPTEWATLPQEGEGDTDSGLGGISYDPATDSTYVVNMFDNTIYRVTGADNATGTVETDTYTPDLGTSVHTPTGATFENTPFGLDVYDGRLYYTVQDATGGGSLVVRSVGLNPDGTIDTADDQEEIREVMPNTFTNFGVQGYPVAGDIDFSASGQMAVGSFTTGLSNSFGGVIDPAYNYYVNKSESRTYNHSAFNRIYETSDETWNQTAITSVGQVGWAGSSTNGTATGGVAWSQETSSPETLWMTGGDFANSDSLWGAIGYNSEQFDNTLNQEDASDYIQFLFPGQNAADPKGNGGDVDVYGTHPIEIGDRIWRESDNDGIQDADEYGIEGVTVSLYDADNNLVATTVTDAQGEYKFNDSNVNQNGANGLKPNANYQIRLDNAADFEFGGALKGLDLAVEGAGDNDQIDSDAVETDIAGTLTPTIDVTTNNYGDNDYSQDIGFNGEEPDITLVGWVDFNRDGVFSEDEAIAIDTETGLIADGVTPNTLEFIAPEGIEQGPTAARFRVAKGLIGDNLDATTPNGSVPNGEVEDYVVNLIIPGAISGNVSEDTTEDGLGDTPIPGVILSLIDSDGNPVTDSEGNPVTTTTNENGDYLFDDVIPGDYSVVETQPAGYRNVSEDEGGTDDDQPDDTVLNSIAVTVEAGETDAGNDFVEVLPRSDFGDAPDTLPGAVSAADNLADNGNDIPDYQSTAVDGGAVHELNSDAPIVIGDNVDADDGTLQNPRATADDQSDTGAADDETGVLLEGTDTPLDNAELNVEPGNTIAVDVEVSALIPDGEKATAPEPTNFGGTITGTAYQDNNVDGTQAVDELGLGDVVVNVYDADHNLIATTTTSNDSATLGEYTIALDPADSSQVRLEFVTPDGLQIGSNSNEEGSFTRFIDTAGGAVTDVNVGFVDPESLTETPPLEIGDRLFRDYNEDGVQDANEPGINGVTLNLLDDAGEVIATTDTNGDGEYSFGGVAAADLLQPNTNYTIQIVDGEGTPLNNLVLTGSDQGDNDALDSDATEVDGVPTIQVTTGESNDFTFDAGFVEKYKDTDVTLVGWIDFDRDGVFSADEAVELDTSEGLLTEDDTNTLTFDVPADVLPGAAAARFRVASGLTGDNLDANTPGGAVGDGEVEDYVVNLVPPGSISGNVSEDTTGDKDGDTPLGNVTLTLFDSEGEEVTTTTTDGDGNYSFENLIPGDYTVVQTQPENLINISEDEGGEDDDKEDDGVINSIAANVESGIEDTGNDFVETKPGSISGNVSEDTEENGIGDKPLNNVTLTLFDSEGEEVATTTTDADGNYIFEDLLPGDYTVVETQPDGLEDVSEDEGGLDNDRPDDTVVNSIQATVAPGEEDVNNDFVEALPTSDLGDAPDTVPGSAAAPDDTTPPDYQTTLTDGGAIHQLDENNPFTIGTEVDSDDGTAQNVDATADGADEDGVKVAGTNTPLDGSDVVVGAGDNYSVDVTVHDGVTPLPTLPTGVAATVSGTVFNDYDNSGTQETNNTAAEVGLEGVTVTAYNNAGNVVSTATTDATGAYTLDNSTGEPLRIEFTDLPEGFTASAGSGSNVIFTDGATANEIINHGVFDPNRYVTGDPRLVTACYVFSGAAGADGQPAIVTVLHSDSGTNPGSKQNLVSIGEVGAVNGLAYHKETGDIFAGAFQKRHSDIGPEGNDAIYRIDSDGNVTPFINLDEVLGTTDVAGAYAHDDTDFLVDAPAFATVGKVALGDVEISEDRQHIYTVNLADRKIYKIAVGDDANPTIPVDYTAGDTRTVDSYDILAGINNAQLGINPEQNIRPFALSAKDGLIYVGMVNSAQYDAAGEEGNTTRDDLQAYIYTFDPATETFSNEPVLDFPLNYAREPKGFFTSGALPTEYWTPWVDSFDTATITDGVLIQNTQPILSDIEFDNNGDLIVGFRDRSADQIGPRTPDTDGNGNYLAHSAGDILRASLNEEADGWNIEPSVLDTDDSLTTNPEYYDGELYRRADSGHGHFETAQGGLVQIPGFSTIETTAMDPTNFTQGGLISLDNTSGDKTSGTVLFNQESPFFGKSNGLGDLEYFGELAPIEIGNRVWNDLDGDGIQDAGEVGFEGVTVSLYDADDNLVATTTTDAKGEYYFNNDNVTENGATGLEPNSNYQIRLDNPADFDDGGVLNGLDITVQDVNDNGDDTTDSDAVDDAGTPTIIVTTGDYGENDYSYDAGLHKEIPPSPDITLVGWVDFNRDGVFSEEEAITLDSENGLVTDGVTPNTLEFTAPDGVEAGPTAARFRVASGLVGDNLNAASGTGLAPNGEVEDYVVNLIVPGSLSGNVSEDTTGDDLGDTPIEGVTLALFDADNNPVSDEAGEPLTTTTDAEGNYIFENLLPGDYTVVETQPENYFDVSEDEGGEDDDLPDDTFLNSIAATVDDKEEDTGNDFVEVKPGSLSGNVGEDTNGDGVGDTPIANVTLTLFDSEDNEVATTTTDDAGNYIFEDLVPGEYTVVEDQPADLLSVTENEGGEDNDRPDDEVVNSIAAIVTPDEEDINNDFVEGKPGSISGNVSQDTTDDGEGNAPIEGVTLTLFDAEGSEPITDDDGNPVTATTDPTGNYTFDNVVPGKYTVVETQPAGLINVSENEGGEDDDFPDNQLINSIAVEVLPEEGDTGNDFVEKVLPPSDLGDAPDTLPGSQAAPDELTPPDYQTTAGDGGAIHELGENLSIAMGALVDADDGTQQNPDATADDGAGDADEDGVLVGGTTDSLNGQTLEVRVGENVSVDVTVDNSAPAGNEDTTLVGWMDFNRDGIFATEEAIVLDTSNGLVTDSATANTLEFTVPAEIQSGLTAARFRVASGLTGDNLDADSATGTVLNGEVEDYVVNLVSLHTISGTVYADEENDDTFSDGDAPLERVTLELFADDGNGEPDGEAIASVETDENGLYEFPDLPNGDYVIVQTQPEGYDSLQDIDDVDDNKILATINNADVVEQDFLDEIPIYNLSGTVLEDTQAALDNALDNPGDTPIEGVTIELFADDGNGEPDGAAIAMTETNSEGFYEFTELPAGDYVVLETQPVGFDSVLDVDGGEPDKILATIVDEDIIGRDFLEERPLLPTVDLDGDNDLTGNDFDTSFVVGGEPVSISDDVLIGDLDSINLQNATVKLTVRADGDTVESLTVAGDLPEGITAEDYDPATGILTLTGDAPLADYQTAIAQIEYNNSIGYHANDRQIEVTVNDGLVDSNTAIATISLDFKPSIDLDSDNSASI